MSEIWHVNPKVFKRKMSKKSSSRFRHWCFTSFQDGVRDPECAVYFCAGKEISPETGRRHIQGYISFEHGKTLSAVKALLGDPAAHLERRRGTEREAAEYCQKVGGPKACCETYERTSRDAWVVSRRHVYEHTRWGVCMCGLSVRQDIISEWVV